MNKNNYYVPIFGNQKKNKNVLFSDHLPVEAEQDGLRVVSFNASFVLGDLVAYGNKEFPSEKEFVRRVLKWMKTNQSYHPHNKFVNVMRKKNPDIICIQESPTIESAKLITGLKSLGYITKQNTSGPENKKEYILTCFSESKFELYDSLNEVNSDKLKSGRPLQACIIKDRNRRESLKRYILVINLHSPNPASDKNIFNTKKTHQQVIQEGLKYVWSNVKDGTKTRITHVVLCGDFNDANHLYHKVEPLYKSEFRIEGFKLKLNTSKLPKTCCSYALNKVTRLPGDYIMIAARGIYEPTTITAFPENGLPKITQEFRNAGNPGNIKPNLMKNGIHREYTKHRKTKQFPPNLKSVLNRLKKIQESVLEQTKQTEEILKST